MANFQPPNRSSLANGDSDSEGEEARTPKEDRMEIDDPGSGGAGRSTRGEPSFTFLAGTYIC